MAVAKNSGMPGTTASGLFTYGTIFSCGDVSAQPVRPAIAIDAPITFRKPRRLSVASQISAPCGNSWRSRSWKSAVSASSSRLRQYSLPRRPARRARSAARFSGSLVIHLLHSAVTDRTIGELTDFDVIGLHQLASQGQLVGRRLVIGIENLVL